jgi:hypothetical protein
MERIRRPGAERRPIALVQRRLHDKHHAAMPAAPAAQRRL